MLDARSRLGRFLSQHPVEDVQMECPKCSRPITRAMYFCIHCGSQLPSTFLLPKWPYPASDLIRQYIWALRFGEASWVDEICSKNEDLLRRSHGLFSYARERVQQARHLFPRRVWILGFIIVVVFSVWLVSTLGHRQEELEVPVISLQPTNLIQMSTAVPLETLDGRFLLLTQRVGITHLYMTGQDGVRQVQLKVSLESLADPVWAPDGRRFAFSGVAGGARNLYIGTDAGEVCQVTTARVPVSSPTWSSDGLEIAYLEDQQALLTTATCPGTLLRTVLDPYADLVSLARSGQGVYGLVSQRGQTRRLWFAGPDGTVMGPTVEGMVGLIHWNPGGQLLAYTLDNGNASALRILELTTDINWMIFNADRQIRSLSWNPAGTGLVFVLAGGAPQLFGYDANAHLIRPLVVNVADIVGVSWGPSYKAH